MGRLCYFKIVNFTKELVIFTIEFFSVYVSKEQRGEDETVSRKPISTLWNIELAACLAFCLLFASCSLRISIPKPAVTTPPQTL